MVRIIGGEFKGRKLRTPRSRRVRPTLDRARETLFALLGERIIGAYFLDLFAGCGAVGLEALSRGAERVVMVEGDAFAARVLRENVRRLEVEDRVRTVVGRLPGALRKLRDETPFDMVFSDPPYDTPLLADTWRALHQAPERWRENTVFVAQHDRRRPPPAAPWPVVRVHAVGSTQFTFYSNAAS